MKASQKRRIAWMQGHPVGTWIEIGGVNYQVLRGLEGSILEIKGRPGKWLARLTEAGHAADCEVAG